MNMTTSQVRRSVVGARFIAGVLMAASAFGGAAALADAGRIGQVHRVTAPDQEPLAAPLAESRAPGT